MAANWMPSTILREYGPGWSVRLLRRSGPNATGYMVLVSSTGQSNTFEIGSYSEAMNVYTSEIVRMKREASFRTKEPEKEEEVSEGRGKTRGRHPKPFQRKAGI